MNLSQIRADGYKLLSVISDDDDCKAQKKAFQYIETLATQTNTTIDHWNVLALFSQKDDALPIVIDKKEINKRFFEYKSKEPVVDNKEQLSSIKDILSKAIKLSGKNLRSQELEALKRKYRDSMSNAHSHERDVLSFVTKAAKEYSAIAVLEGRDEEFEIKQIELMMNDKFWEFVSFDGLSLTFTTRNDIILTDINPAAGMHLRVNMGKMMARVPIRNIYDTRVLRFKDNLNASNGYFHPHVRDDNRGNSSAGVICWGNASESASEMAASWQLHAFMQLLGTLISSYSKENPYVDLVTFQRLRPHDGPAIPLKIERSTLVEEEEDEDDETEEDDEVF